MTTPINNGGILDKYSWTQTAYDLTITVPLPDDINRKEIEVDVTNKEVYVKQNATIKVDKNVTATIGENLSATVNKNATLKVSGNFQADIGGTCKITSGGNMTFKAPRIDLN